MGGARSSVIWDPKRPLDPMMCYVIDALRLWLNVVLIWLVLFIILSLIPFVFLALGRPFKEMITRFITVILFILKGLCY